MSIPGVTAGPVLVAAAGYWLLGEVWYSPLLCRHAWQRWTPGVEALVRRDFRAQLIAVTYAGVMSWLTAVVIASAGVHHPVLGCLCGEAVLVGTKLFSTLTYAGTKGVGSRAWWIHVACQGIGFAWMGGLLAVWR